MPATALHRNAAATYATKNVRINCVAPGLINSPLAAQTLGDNAFKRSAQLYPMKRIAEPEEVAHALAFLLHPKASFTTGATIPVDGGLSTVEPTGLTHA